MLLARVSPSSSSWITKYSPSPKCIRFFCSSNSNHKYGATLLLPKTTLPMAYSAAKEGGLLYDPSKLYNWQLEHNPGSSWITHDGPPYANGDLHLGHVFNKSLKDFINRYKSMRGHRVSFVPGWDCHGLPIELLAIKKIRSAKGTETSAKEKEMGAREIRRHAKEYAMEQVANQKKEFMSLGIMGDWSHPYLTLDPQYCAEQLRVFSTLYAKGYVYRGVKPVHWSPSSRTALADAELEYNDNHVSPSIYVSFPVVKLAASATALSQYTSLKAVIWTTTPWTLPANMAIAVSTDITYCVVKWQGDHLIVAQDRMETLQQKLSNASSQTQPSDWKVVDTIAGNLLENTQCIHPLNGRVSPIVLSPHVTTTAGTGLVHTAPGHGEEDFAAGKKYNLQVLSPVDAHGNFTEEVGDADLVGKFVLTDGNKIVIDKLNLKGFLLAQESFTHKYPYDWRTKKPVIVRATAQWFVDLSHIHEKAVEAIQKVQMYPPNSRLASMVAGRSSWCISRQRAWGVPIPVFYHRETGEPLLNDETMSYILDIVSTKGTDAWWEMPTEDLLSPKYRNDASNWEKGTDTMDVWFDSGVSWAAVLKQRGIGFPANVYVEGTDQHRGWFQSSLLTSICIEGVAPYRSIVTHGFLLDEKGQKMAKSLGNTLAPSFIIRGGKDPRANPAFGVDVLRLLVASSDYMKDITVGPSILSATRDSFSKIRNTLRFALGNTADFSYPKDSVPYHSLAAVDKYILHKLYQIGNQITNAYDVYHFANVFRQILNFCTVDLSAFYYSIVKMGLYVDYPTSQRRRSAQTVLYMIISIINKAWAPFVPHASEEIHSHWTANPKKAESIFAEGWLGLEEEWNNLAVADQFHPLMLIRDEVTKLLEVMRSKKIIGRQEEAELDLYSDSSELSSLPLDVIDEILQVSAVRLHSNSVPVSEAEWKSQLEVMINGKSHRIIIVGKEATMMKCPRCWRHHSSQKDQPCESCKEILEKLKS